MALAQRSANNRARAPFTVQGAPWRDDPHFASGEDDDGTMRIRFGPWASRRICWPPTRQEAGSANSVVQWPDGPQLAFGCDNN
jgi:hypothetical protein